MNERIIVFIAIENKGPHSSAMRPLAGWLTDTADLGVAEAAAAVGGIIPVTIEIDGVAGARPAAVLQDDGPEIPPV